MAGTARALGPSVRSVGSNFEAELSREQGREIEQLLMADDCAAEAFDPDESLQSRSGQVHLRERRSGHVQLLD
jgi:hypothetical protein